MLLATQAAGLAQGPISSGERKDGAIAILGELDSWTIECPIDGQLLVQVAEVSGSYFDPRIELYAVGSPTLIASSWGADSASILRNVTAGTYTIRIMDATDPADGTGSYSLHAALPGVPFSTPAGDDGGSLASGAIIDGTIDLADMDLFSFDAQPGDGIIINLTELSGTENFTPRVSLYTPAGVYYSNGTTFAYNVSMGGAHTIVVRDHSGGAQNTGTYRLRFLHPRALSAQPIHGNGQWLTTDQIYSGSISEVDELDYFFIEAGHGESIICKLEDVAAGAFRPYLRIYAPDGGMIRSNAHGQVAYTYNTATDAGRYTVVVADADRGTGNYRISCSHPPEAPSIPASDEGGSIPNGGYVDGAIGVADMDTYIVDVVGGERIQLQLAELSDNNFVPRVSIYNPKGEHLTSAISASYYATGTTLSTGIDAQVGGKYTVVVEDSSENNSNSPGTGSYRLHLATTSQPYTIPVGDEGGLLSNGNYHDGTIGYADIDLYHFEAEAGDTVFVDATAIGAGNLAPVVWVFDPWGTRLLPGSDNQIKIGHTASYTVMVFDSRSLVVAGDYRLYYSKSSGAFTTLAGDEGGGLVHNTTTTGTIDVADIDLYTFSATAGDDVSLAFGDSDSDGFYPYISIYDPNGEALSLSISQTTYSADVALSGTYTVRLAESAASEGTYEFLFTQTPGSTAGPMGTAKGAIANGSQVSGNMTSSGQQHRWTFHAVAGKPVWLMLQAPGTFPNVTPVMRVFAPSGALVYHKGWGSRMMFPRFIAEESGTYTIELTNESTSVAYVCLYLSPSSDYVIPAAADGGSLLPGIRSSASLGVGDIDVWEFNAQAGDKIFLKMGDRTESGINPRVEVRQPNGVIAALDESGFYTASCEFIAGQTGRYLVMVNSYDPGDAGDYDLNLAILSNAYVATVDEDGGTLENGIYSASIPYGDIDLWNFSAQVGDRIHLAAANAGSPGQQARMDVFDPDGIRIVMEHEDSAHYAMFTAAKAGSYTVKIDCGANRLSTYKISYVNLSAVASLPEGDNRGILYNGGIHEALLEAGDIDVWTFDADQDQWLWLQVSGVVGSMAVYDPSGRLTHYDDSLPEYELLTAEAGTYTVMISNNTFTPQPNGYKIHYARMGSPYATAFGDHGGAVEANEIQTGNISAGDMDLWSFNATAGEWVNVQVTELSGSSLSPYIAVYSPEGVKILSGYNGVSQAFSFRAPTTGFYVVLIRDYANGYNTGDYEFVATGMTPAPVGFFPSAMNHGQFRLAWPSPSSGWELQESTSMLPDSWSASPLVPVDNGYEKSIDVDTSSASRRFFRLFKP